MNLQTITSTIKQGGIIAYPTEGVYGLGCDPFNEAAVNQLLQLKQRPVNKGLLLIASNWEQIQALTKPVPKENFQRAQATWPGPHTWLFPASDRCPTWIRGHHKTIALRITSHPVARMICETLQQAIVSTSANLAGQPPLKRYAAVATAWQDSIDFIVDGEVGDLEKPTSICNVLTGELIRE